MNAKLKWMLSLVVVGGVAWYFVHSHQTQVKQNTGAKKIKFMGEMWDEMDSTLAHQYNCPVFKPELVKKTDSMFTFQIQRFLDDNKRVAAIGSLDDMFQTSNHIEASFELQFYTGDDDEIFAELECPTNLVSKLASMHVNSDQLFGLVFDIDNVRLKYEEIADEDDSTKIDREKLIQGRLLAVDPL
jgi:hypothetical protein